MVLALLRHMLRLVYRLPLQSEVNTDQGFHNQHKNVPVKT